MRLSASKILPLSPGCERPLWGPPTTPDQPAGVVIAFFGGSGSVARQRVLRGRAAWNLLRACRTGIPHHSAGTKRHTGTPRASSPSSDRSRDRLAGSLDRHIGPVGDALVLGHVRAPVHGGDQPRVVAGCGGGRSRRASCRWPRSSRSATQRADQGWWP
jgi:hypothetical protein